jgi:RimJ/RimL family protein N-acetyltransferase
LYTEPSSRKTGAGVEAALLFGDYLFKFFAIRKLYAEVYEFNVDSMDVLLNAGFVQEGMLKEHLWYENRYWNMHQLALYRDDWTKLRDRVSELFESRKPRRTDRSYLTNGSTEAASTQR